MIIYDQCVTLLETNRCDDKNISTTQIKKNILPFSIDNSISVNSVSHYAVSSTPFKRYHGEKNCWPPAISDKIIYGLHANYRHEL